MFDSSHRTDLDQSLKQHAAMRHVVCGMHTEFCVDTTTCRALALGYPVVLVTDAHTTEGREHLSASQIIRHHNVVISGNESFGPRVRTIAAADLRFEV